MGYTVKQLARMAGVTPRTLHYYDEIGLLPPDAYGENGYRFYSDENMLRLQQILFFRELGFRLEEIGEILARPDFDVLLALQSHKKALKSRMERLRSLIHTVDATIEHLKGNQTMEDIHQLFEGFTPEQEKYYTEEAEKRWGDSVKESARLWNSYSADKKKAILAEGKEIYLDLIARLEDDPSSKEVQAIIARWHQNMRYFYEPTLEILRGLSQGYVVDPQFRETFDRMHPALAEYMQRAVHVYCDSLEN